MLTTCIQRKIQYLIMAFKFGFADDDDDVQANNGKSNSIIPSANVPDEHSRRVEEHRMTNLVGTNF